MKTIDCLGDMCPVPLMKLRECDELKNSGDSIMLVTDHSCVCESITAYCEKKKLHIRIEEPMNGIWEMYITCP